MMIIIITIKRERERETLKNITKYQTTTTIIQKLSMNEANELDEHDDDHNHPA
mgnify:CR=1 FL=1